MGFSRQKFSWPPFLPLYVKAAASPPSPWEYVLLTWSGTNTLEGTSLSADDMSLIINKKMIIFEKYFSQDKPYFLFVNHNFEPEIFLLTTTTETPPPPPHSSTTTTNQILLLSKIL